MWNAQSGYVVGIAQPEHTKNKIKKISLAIASITKEHSMFTVICTTFRLMSIMKPYSSHVQHHTDMMDQVPQVFIDSNQAVTVGETEPEM